MAEAYRRGNCCGMSEALLLMVELLIRDEVREEYCMV